MKTKFSNIFIKTFGIFAFCLLFIFGLYFCTCNKIFAEPNLTYTISSSANGYKISKTMAQTTTVIQDNITKFEDIINIIDNERFVEQQYQDATINFDNISIGNSSVELAHGNYTIKGSLTSLEYSTFGLFYINNDANVTFENGTFINKGESYLIRKVGTGNLTIIDGKYSSYEDTIKINGSGDLNIKGGEISSQNSVAINFTPNTENSKLIISNGTITADQDDLATIYATSSEIDISGGEIKNKGQGKSLYLNNSTLTLSKTPKINSILTNSTISAKKGTKSYTGNTIKIFYSKDISEGQTVVNNIDENNKTKFELTNENYQFKNVNSTLQIYKVYTITYQDPKHLIYTLPIDTNKYFSGDKITVAGITQIISHYTFLGWSDGSNLYQKDEKISVNNSNITLTAQWEAHEFDIIYHNVEATEIQGDNFPNGYNSDSQITIGKPSRDYYTFLGWSKTPNGTAIENFTISSGSNGELNLYAQWKATEYKIKYNIPSNVFIPNLVTEYTVETEQSLTIKLENLMFVGYSFFGVYYDEDLTKSCENDEIDFTDINGTNNSSKFLKFNSIGEDINIYIDYKAYQNKQGNGSKNNPFIIETPEQFRYLYQGKKLNTTEKIYVSLKDNLELQNSIENISAPLNNFCFDGNNKTIKINQLNEFENYYALFPKIKNSTIQNLKIDAENTLILNANNSKSFGIVIGLGENVELYNIQNNINIDLSSDSLSTTSIIKFGGIATEITGIHNTLNNISNNGNINITITNNLADINLYVAGLISNYALSTNIFNSANNGNITINLNSTSNTFDIRTYISGIAILDRDNNIINCLNSGDITVEQNKPYRTVIGALGVAFNDNCLVATSVNSGKISANSPFVTKNVTVWQGHSNCQVSSCQDLSESSIEIFSDGKIVSEMNTQNNIYATQFNTELTPWYYNKNFAPTRTPSILINYFYNGIKPDEKILYTNINEAKSKFAFIDNYIFYGWKTDNGNYVDYNNVNTAELNLYVSGETVEHYITVHQTIAVLIAVLILVAVLVAMFFFDKKKYVTFIYNGSIIKREKIARTKPIELPSKFRNRLWFTDQNGLKPFTKNKMPFHSLTLYLFEGEKQENLEAHYKSLQKQEQELAEENAKLEAEKRLAIQEQKRIEKEQKEQERIKREKEKSKQNNLSSDSKITVIKKEIKVIKKTPRKK